VIPARTGAFAIAVDFTSAAALFCGKASVCTYFILISSFSVFFQGLVRVVPLDIGRDLQILKHSVGNPRSALELNTISCQRERMYRRGDLAMMGHRAKNSNVTAGDPVRRQNPPGDIPGV
jgi:hypothetical protein